jgi:hypothetical protein
MVIGMALPISTGDNRPVIAPLGQISFLVDRASVDKIAEAGSFLSAAPKLPKDFTIAQDLGAVERAASEMRKVTGT